MPKKNIYFKFDMLILSILKHRDCYGYEITHAIRDLSGGVVDIKEGSLYPSLYKMLEKGYITSNETIINRKIRVYYHITEEGKEYFEKITNEYFLWEEKIRAVLNYNGDIKEI